MLRYAGAPHDTQCFDLENTNGQKYEHHLLDKKIQHARF